LLTQHLGFTGVHLLGPSNVDIEFL